MRRLFIVSYSYFNDLMIFDRFSYLIAHILISVIALQEAAIATDDFRLTV
jgi:hypothetical protein